MLGSQRPTFSLYEAELGKNHVKSGTTTEPKKGKVKRKSSILGILIFHGGFKGNS